jgi:hypothetical protein
MVKIDKILKSDKIVWKSHLPWNQSIIVNEVENFWIDENWN